MKINKPTEIVFQCIKKMVALGILLNRVPKKVLIIGIGGGTEAEALKYLYPNITFD